ncbi:transposase [Maribellus luteus]|uniref:Transposase n=1 Tax=Maribellus luteus TaxID=2305463 RepID=A0A399SSW6_9BACT|nr:transposase [Maribellus luteus]RIJ45243.1 transposase [Maribellus luteus]
MSGFIVYDESFKRRVVAEVLTGQISKEEARRRYHIAGHCTVLKWIRKFEAQSLQITFMKSDSHTSKEDLLKRIKELERQVEDEKLRSEALSLMIDIAEKQLDIEIRKKPGTKQSKR